MAARRSPRQSASTHADGAAVKGRRRDREVLNAATTVFYTRGYADATVQDVADALGILKGSLYYYMKGKEELLYRLAIEVHDDVDAVMAAVLALDDLSPLERIQEFVRRQVDYNLRHLEAIAVYHHDTRHLSKALHKEISERRRKHEAILVSLINQAQVDGEVNPDLDAYVASQSIFATMIWIYRWYRPSSPVSPATVRDTCLAFVSGGLGGAGSRTAAGGRVRAGIETDTLPTGRQ